MQYIFTTDSNWEVCYLLTLGSFFKPFVISIRYQEAFFMNNSSDFWHTYDYIDGLRSQTVAKLKNIVSLTTQKKSETSKHEII